MHNFNSMLLCDDDYRVVTSTDATDAYENHAFMRASDGSLLITTDDSNLADDLVHGFIVDADTGALYVGTDDTDAYMDHGFMRTSDGGVLVSDDDPVGITWAPWQRTDTGAMSVTDAGSSGPPSIPDFDMDVLDDFSEATVSEGTTLADNPAKAWQTDIYAAGEELGYWATTLCETNNVGGADVIASAGYDVNVAGFSTRVEADVIALNADPTDGLMVALWLDYRLGTEAGYRAALTWVDGALHVETSGTTGTGVADRTVVDTFTPDPTGYLPVVGGIAPTNTVAVSYVHDRWLFVELNGTLLGVSDMSVLSGGSTHGGPAMELCEGLLYGVDEVRFGTA